MDNFIIEGGHELFGEVNISGAKNAAVAIIPAAILADDVVRIENIPAISDVSLIIKILDSMGAGIKMINKKPSVEGWGICLIRSYTQCVTNSVAHLSAVERIEVKIFHPFATEDLHHVHGDIRPHQLTGFGVVIQPFEHF